MECSSSSDLDAEIYISLTKVYCMHSAFEEVIVILLLQTLRALNTGKSDIGITAKLMFLRYKLAS